MPARTARLASVRSFARAVRSAARPGSAGLGTRLAALPRIARAIRSGDYLGASTGNLLTLAAATLYVASPVDLMPEGILGVLGLGDDAVLLAYAASTFVNLTEDFLAWETAAGSTARRDEQGYHGPTAGCRDTVQGSVLR